MRSTKLEAQQLAISDNLPLIFISRYPVFGHSNLADNNAVRPRATPVFTPNQVQEVNTGPNSDKLNARPLQSQRVRV